MSLGFVGNGDPRENHPEEIGVTPHRND